MSGSGHGQLGFDEMGFGLGRGLWGSACTTTYPEVGDLVGNFAGSGPPDTWQMNGTDDDGGDLLGWPDLAISMQGKSLK